MKKTGLVVVMVLMFCASMASVVLAQVSQQTAEQVRGIVTWKCTSNSKVCQLAVKRHIIRSTHGEYPFALSMQGTDYESWHVSNGGCQLFYDIYGAMPVGCEGGEVTVYGPGDPVPHWVIQVGWLAWSISFYHGGEWITAYGVWDFEY